MKKILFLLLSSLMLVGCSNNNDSFNEQVSQTTQHHIVDLSGANYLTYLNYEIQAQSATQAYLTVYGVLNYAFYENVVIQLKVHLTKSSSFSAAVIDEYENISLPLNAAGYGTVSFTTNGYLLNKTTKISEVSEFSSCNRSLTICGVSGKVIYNI
ncbi:MAG: hypothetical protein KBS97_03020 [Firmicutes bacterium]|nr:hypothetical protein [Candidatus Fiminaster equi]